MGCFRFPSIWIFGHPVFGVSLYFSGESNSLIEKPSAELNLCFTVSICLFQCVTAVDGYWLAELGPMFFSVKETGKSRSEGKKVALDHLKTMEREMKSAEEELLRRKEEEREREEREKQKAVIATPGRFGSGQTPKRTPHRFGI